MLYRHKFITNSSSTNYCVYGIGLNREEFYKLIKILWVSNMDKFTEGLRGYYDDEEFSQLYTSDDVVDAVIEMDEWEDFVSDFLPRSVQIVWAGDNGSSDYFLAFDKCMGIAVEDDKVILKDFSAKDVTDTINLAKEAGIIHPIFTLVHWTEYS